MNKPVVLVIDDEKNIREGLRSALKLEGFDVIASEDGLDGLEKLKTLAPDAIILDLKMPKLGGMEFLKEAHGINNEAPIIILTGHGDVDDAVESMKRGAYDFLTKPVNIDKLSLILKRSLDEIELKNRQDQLEEMVDEKYHFKNVVGSSKAFQRILQVVKQVAPTDASILITGESGTGKEVIANSIHTNSSRSKGPFIKVHCAALPETLLESELFGHEKGAFTGAIARKRGRFELADGGTIFLDEIGDISPNVQVKLLRVLQEQEFDRVGGEETIKVNIRIITATNKDLKKMTEEGKFREDLFYRLNIVNIHVPALRDRKEDIPLFVDYFIKSFCKKHGRKVKEIQPKALKFMENYRWPGNVRELQNLIENLVVLNTEPLITEEMLPQYIRGNITKGNIYLDVGTTMDEIEKKAIISTLDFTNWNKSRAAKILNIGRKTLLRKLEEYGFSVKDEEEQDTSFESQS
jgi:DNA-binding NtrC family response regulator